MLDLGNFPASTGATDVQRFIGDSATVGQTWKTWVKPRGKSMVHIFALGQGGGGGSSNVGVASTMAGGGGGGSGGQTVLLMPLALLPDTLFISAGRGGAPTATGTTAAQATFSTYITTQMPSAVGAPVANTVLLIANGGASGGGASGATIGALGTAGAIATNVTMPIGWAFSQLALAGLAGTAGTTAATQPTALAYPTTGLLCTGGCGGAGVGAAASAGAAGGAITAISGVRQMIGSPAGAAGTASTSGGNGSAGYFNGWIWTGASGGGSGGTSAATSGGTGGDARQAYGCGGGGAGGGFTGGTAASGGFGGPSLIIITCW